MRLRVVDIETTGGAPPAEIIEFGRVDVVADGSGWSVERPMARLYRPLHGIPSETMAIHHITEDDFDEATPICSQDRLRQAVWAGEAPDALVAHYCDFERVFIADELTAPLPWICTYKVALRVWPEAPGHSNQVLRYWRQLSLEKAYAMPPHRASPDAYVTSHILFDLLKEATVDQMIAWTAEPKYLPAVPFGKHRGVKWEEAPIDYLQWMVRQAEMDKDALWHAQRELSRREA